MKHPLGHICHATTAREIQKDKIIKAQAPPGRKTKACYFVDFRCIMSIVKGTRILEKHMEKEGKNARWGFYVQREDVGFSLEEKEMEIKTIWGARFVYACKHDVLAAHFQYLVVPDRLPFGAFLLADLWRRPLTQWASLSEHKHLTRVAQTERANFQEIANQGLHSRCRSKIETRTWELFHPISTILPCPTKQTKNRNRPDGT